MGFFAPLVGILAVFPGQADSWRWDTPDGRSIELTVVCLLLCSLDFRHSA